MGVMTPNVMEFLGEDEMISILPSFDMKENNGYLNCISGDYGPFNPAFTTSVPLWLAIAFKKMKKARLIQPTWMSVEFLTEKLEREQETNVFQDMPYHYMEISALLLQHASEDIEDLERIRTLLEDIQNVRQDKIRNGLQLIATDVQNGGTAYAVQMNNVGGLEINSVRYFMLESLDRFYEFNGTEKKNSLDDSLNSTQTFSSGFSQDNDSSQGTPATTPFVQPLRRRG